MALNNPLLYTLPTNINGYIPFLILLYTLPTNINGYVPFIILLYTLPMNINGYVLFLILLYTLPMNINGYVPFLINRLETIVRGGKMLTKLFTISSDYLLHVAGEYCILFNTIKISILFPTCILVISHSVTFC